MWFAGVARLRALRADTLWLLAEILASAPLLFNGFAPVPTLCRPPSHRQRSMRKKVILKTSALKVQELAGHNSSQWDRFAKIARDAARPIKNLGWADVKADDKNRILQSVNETLRSEQIPEVDSEIETKREERQDVATR